MECMTTSEHSPLDIGLSLNICYVTLVARVTCRGKVHIEIRLLVQGRRSELKVEGAERVNITESRNSTA